MANSKSPSRFSRKSAAGWLELARWALGALALFATWLLLRVRFDLPISRGDSLTSFIHIFRLLAAEHGNWNHLAYDYRWLGGVRLAESVGPSVLVSWFAKLGLGPIAIENSQILFTQSTLSFWVLRLALELKVRLFRDPSEPSFFTWAIASVGAGFLPVLGWRFFNGHTLLLQGAIPPFALSAVAMSMARGSISPQLFLFAVFSVWFPLTTQSAQLIYYGSLWMTPFTLAILLPGGLQQTAKACGLAFAVSVCGFLLAFPEFFAMAGFYRSEEASRTGEFKAIYTYTTQTGRDWLNSVFSHASFFPDDQPGFLLQETRFPFGKEALLGIAAFASSRIKRFWPLACLLTSAFIAIVIASQIEPFSRWFIAALPGYDAFRVPARSLIPLILLVWSLATASFFLLCGSLKVKPSVLALTLGGAIVILLVSSSPLLLEIFFGLASFTFVYFHFYGRKQRHAREACLVAMLVISFGNAFSSLEKRPTDLSEANLSRQMKLISETFNENSRFPISGIHRAEAEFGLNSALFNTSAQLGVASLSGIFYPLRRFNLVFTLLEQKSFFPIRSWFVNDLQKENLRPLDLLYNVDKKYTLSETGVLASTPVHDWGHPGAWLSETSQPTLEMASSLSGLKSVADLRRVQILSARDALTQATIENAGRAVSCKRGSVRSLNALSAQSFRLDLESASDCPVTLSLNFTRILRVACVDPSPAEIVTYPAYGALLGFKPQKPCRTYSISADPVFSGWRGRKSSTESH